MSSFKRKFSQLEGFIKGVASQYPDPTFEYNLSAEEKERKEMERGVREVLGDIARFISYLNRRESSEKE